MLVNVRFNAMEINIDAIEWVIGHHQPVAEAISFSKLKVQIHFHFAVRLIDVDWNRLYFRFLVHHYQVTLQSGSEYLQTRGKVSVTLVGSIETVSVVFDKYVEMKIEWKMDIFI